MRTLKNLFTKRRAAALCLLLALGAAWLLLPPPSSGRPPLSGEAEAVLTTQVTVYDGLWEATRHSDEFYSPSGLALSGGRLIVADVMADRVQTMERLFGGGVPLY